MSCDYHLLPHPGIQSLHPYVPGKSIRELEKETGLTDIIKLASNENQLGCSPRVKETLAELTIHQIATYPSPAIHPLRGKLSAMLGIPESMLVFGNGSDSLFSFLLTLFAVNRNKHILTHDLAFISYVIQAQTLGIPSVQTPVNENYEADIDALITAANEQTALIFLSNPNNPTGILIPIKEIKRLLESIPESTIVVLDEAYYEFAYPHGDKTSLNLLADHPNLVITRTFSKIYGLAGLRIGYAMANPDIIELLLRVQLPFAVNQVALAAAYAALDDQDFVARTLTMNEKGMQQLQEGLDALQLSHIPSCCNFLTFDCGRDSLPIYQELLQNGIIVRPLKSYGLMNHLRVSIGTHQQNTRFLSALSTIMQDTN
ncbi:histidinol-phosphate transaminase [Legionella spiritensis]|uniref:histidinol-phosphate transaminase n=1 Tax=Legionella spiritensis TaxID=452 RepID=UPI000F6E2570|nr:histidinol-phosphate transaminase [Legionella spiritensis]VEG90629.1 histidinol phosphate aminotransferase [Legionella spiritensis]